MKLQGKFLKSVRVWCVAVRGDSRSTVQMHVCMHVVFGTSGALRGDTQGLTGTWPGHTVSDYAKQSHQPLHCPPPSACSMHVSSLHAQPPILWSVTGLSQATEGSRQPQNPNR